MKRFWWVVLLFIVGFISIVCSDLQPHIGIPLMIANLAVYIILARYWVWVENGESK
jgi:protein-S-isoprenylcysteine O-methyltransferase Ste14